MKIFVSYSRHDGAHVNTLQADLAVLGHEVWFDRELTGGQAWWDEILRQVRVCDLFIFALSPRSLESPACDREWRYAAALGKGVLPVLIDGDISVSLLPPPLAALQYIDYREQSKQAALRLSRAIDKLGVAGPLPQPLPQAPEVPLSYLGGLRETIHAAQALSFPEQSALVIKLRHALHEEHESAEIRDLIRQLLDRDDVLARVADELKALLVEPHAAPAPAPTPRPTPAPSTVSEPSPAPAVDEPAVSQPVAPAPAQRTAPPTQAPTIAQATPWFSRKVVWVVGSVVLLLALVSMCSEETPKAPVLDGASTAPAAPAVDPAPAAPAPTRSLPSDQKRQITQDIDQLLKGSK